MAKLRYKVVTVQPRAELVASSMSRKCIKTHPAVTWIWKMADCVSASERAS
jgi:hypothetical protein